MTAPPREILLTGGSGQVGTALRRLAPADWRIVAPTRAEMDLSDPVQIAAFVASRPWAAVISAGAYTAVDRAENDVVGAWRANALGPAALAEASAKAGAPIVHLSTDYVFDGAKPGAYVESDPVGPRNVYGASKEGGEQAVRTANPRHVILRTAWVVSPDGANFIKTMLRLGAERPLLKVVDDQRGCPTSAEDVAQAVQRIVDRLIGDASAPTGSFHFVNAGEATWCELARAVFERAAAAGARRPEVQAITTAEFPTRAVRPRNSVLSTAKLQQAYGIAPRPWREAIDRIVDQLVASAAVGGA